MKNIVKTFFLAVLCAMTFAACQKEPLANQNNNEGEYLYNFSIVNADAPTKTTLNGTTVTWEKNDKLGFFADETENKYGTISSLSPKAIVPVYLTSPLTAGSKVYAYFPYSDKATSVAAIPFKIPASQNGDFDDNPQVSLPYVISQDFAAKQTNVDDMKFCNLGSVILFKVYSSVEAYRSETIKSITFESASNIAGNFTLDATAVDYDYPSTLAPASVSNGSHTISLSCAPAIGSSVENAGEAYMVVIPGSYAGTVTVSTNVANYSYTFTTAKNFVRSSIKPLNIDLGKTGARTTAPTKTFEKITDTPAEIDGEYIFVNSALTYAITGQLVSTDKLEIAPVAASDDGSITCLAECALTISSIGDGELTVQNSDGKYIALKESGNTGAALRDAAESNLEKYVLSFSSTGLASLINQGQTTRSIRFNGTTDARFYTSSNGSSGYLYKLVDSREQLATPSVTVVGNKMEWESVANAGSYTIVIGTQSKSGITGTSYTYSSADFTFDPGYYDVSVYAVPADPTTYKESALGEGDARIQVGTPTLAAPELESSSITASSFVVSWSADSNATNGYTYTINPEPSETPVITNGSATFTGLTAETEYTICIQAAAVAGDEPWAASEIAKIKVSTIAAGSKTEHTVTWTASSNGLGNDVGTGTIKTGDFSWDYTRTLKSGASYSGWISNCIQLGKNGGVENIVLSTSNIPGTIKSVSVECSSYNNAHKVSISVGGTTYLASTATAKWTTVSAATGTGTSSGEIIISFTDGTRALYIKSISVVYEN